MDKPKKLSTKKAFESPYFSIHVDGLEYPNGVLHKYSYMLADDGVCVVAVTDANEVVLVNEYKYPIDGYNLTVPAGGIDSGESPLAAAKRELREETGMVAKKWTKLGTFHPAVGFSAYKGHAFLAQSLTEEAKDLDATEILTIQKMPFTDALEKIQQGKITDSWGIISLQWAKECLE